jgi:hypothetical protein
MEDFLKVAPGHATQLKSRGRLLSLVVASVLKGQNKKATRDDSFLTNTAYRVIKVH